jgi:FkbM family methyltransferase
LAEGLEPVDPNLIFDIGGHIGQDTDFYLKRGFRVVTVEADAELAAGLRSRFSDAIQSGSLTVVEAAISDHSGEGTFYKFAKSVYGTISRDWADRNVQMGKSCQAVEVRFITIQELVHRHGAPYFMKVDIEGADMICIEGFRNLTKPAYISVEIEKHNFEKFRYDVSLIRDLGYRRFQLVQQESVPFHRIPVPPREGPLADHHFPFGSSGLFGRELPQNRWITFEELLAEYEPVVRRHAVYGDYGFGKNWLPRQLLRLVRLYPGWHDLHCRLAD